MYCFISIVVGEPDIGVCSYVAGLKLWREPNGVIDNDVRRAQFIAGRQFYQSETYKKLEIETTKYWHWGSVSLYQEFLHEK